jgi:hypothetical protein
MRAKKRAALALPPRRKLQNLFGNAQRDFVAWWQKKTRCDA